LLPKQALMKSSARQRRTAIGATIGGAATTSAILQSWRLGNGGGKCRSVTIALQVRQGIWQNNANRCSLSDHAFRFDPAAVELRNMFYDG
jgi:hypothetical protein